MELQFFIILLFRRVCSNAMVYAAMFISWAILWNFVQPDILLLRSVDLITWIYSLNITLHAGALLVYLLHVVFLGSNFFCSWSQNTNIGAAKHRHWLFSFNFPNSFYQFGKNLLGVAYNAVLGYLKYWSTLIVIYSYNILWTAHNRQYAGFSRDTNCNVRFGALFFGCPVCSSLGRQPSSETGREHAVAPPSSSATPPVVPSYRAFSFRVRPKLQSRHQWAAVCCLLLYILYHGLGSGRLMLIFSTSALTGVSVTSTDLG